ncbi:hypothetical protein BDR22DRAFT_887569 [Usnea florida]
MRKKIRKAIKGDAEDNVEDDEHELSEDEINLVHSYCRGVFGTVIANEAQKLKKDVVERYTEEINDEANKQTHEEYVARVHEDVVKAYKEQLMKDIDEEWKAQQTEIIEAKVRKERIFDTEATYESYMEANKDLDNEVNEATIIRYLWLLNPDTFRKWVTPDPKGFLKPSDVARFIPPIFKLIQLKQTSARLIRQDLFDLLAVSGLALENGVDIIRSPKLIASENYQCKESHIYLAGANEDYKVEEKFMRLCKS